MDRDNRKLGDVRFVVEAISGVFSVTVVETLTGTTGKAVVPQNAYGDSFFAEREAKKLAIHELIRAKGWL